MIRLAAVGDVHFGRESRGQLSAHWRGVEEMAGALLIAGDLTKVGHLEEAQVLAEDLAECPIPVVAVLGNHDYHSGQEKEIKECLTAAGVQVLDHSATTVMIRSKTVGIYGLKGYCGGYIGACCSDFGESETKSFIAHTKLASRELAAGLQALQTDYKVALLHYSPTADTLLGERKEIYPFLGSYLLAEAIDAGGANVAFHGHAHKGVEHGRTAGGIPVRNVAQPVIQKAFKIYSLDELREDLRKESLSH